MALQRTLALIYISYVKHFVWKEDKRPFHSCPVIDLYCCYSLFRKKVLATWDNCEAGKRCPVRGAWQKVPGKRCPWQENLNILVIPILVDNWGVAIWSCEWNCMHFFSWTDPTTSAAALYRLIYFHGHSSALLQCYKDIYM